MSTSARYRPVRFGVTRARLREGRDGVRYLMAEPPLGPYPERMTDRLRHWAETVPERTLLAQRARIVGTGGTGGAGGQPVLGDWRQVSYREAWHTARCIAQALIERRLSAERPVAILSENGIEHGLLALGCLIAGVPSVPISPAYSLVSTDYGKLGHVLRTVTPGLVFAADPRYGNAIRACVGADTEVVLTEGELDGRPVTRYAELAATADTPAVDAALAATGPDTIVKFLFTSGSTSLPKAVINTQRMWCANQQQMREFVPAFAEDPLVLVDWLPWNHTAGGNHNFGMALYNGGTMYIDEGKPTPALMHETLRNLREIAPTIYFNVPIGFEMIANALRTDDALRRTLLSRVHMFFYAGAALAQPVWDSLFESEEREIGERIVMATGLGMTESGPFAIFVTSPEVQAGDLGLPASGMELKLIDVDGKTEVRYRGPNITPGYWRAPQATAEAFDEEGYFRSGDAVRWIDENDIHRGLKFDGRIAEDFKLATGTFVSVGPMRARIIGAGAPYVRDVVITGLNRNEVGAMVFPTQEVRELSGLPGSASMAEVLASEPVRARFQRLVDELARTATGSASRVARLCLLADPPLIDRGEITDKGSINQRAVLAHRADTVERLHAGELPLMFRPRG